MKKKKELSMLINMQLDRVTHKAARSVKSV